MRTTNIEDVAETLKQSQVDHSAVIMYPGNLTLPKRFDLKGEE